VLRLLGCLSQGLFIDIIFQRRLRRNTAQTPFALLNGVCRGNEAVGCGDDVFEKNTGRQSRGAIVRLGGELDH
jgi:hypothetical protein